MDIEPPADMISCKHNYEKTTVSNTDFQWHLIWKCHQIKSKLYTHQWFRILLLDSGINGIPHTGIPLVRVVRLVQGRKSLYVPCQLYFCFMSYPLLDCLRCKYLYVWSVYNTDIVTESQNKFSSENFFNNRYAPEKMLPILSARSSPSMRYHPIPLNILIVA